MEKDCPITKFRITEVWDDQNQATVFKKEFSTLFKITDEGEFELLTFDKVYKNYLVFINVFNTAIWSKT